MTGRLASRNVIVTGGGAGIGLEIARLFAREGANISIFECDRTHIEKAGSELQTEEIYPEFYRVDVADARSVSLAFEQVFHRMNHVDVLVNNAGIAEFSSIEETTLDSWQRIMAVNVTGTFLCSQAVIPLMKSRGGSIVNFASVAGLVGIPKMPAYCASKAAVIGLTRQLASEYTGLGIRVNSISPGRIAGTELDRWIMTMDSKEATKAKIAQYPLGRFGRMEEVARTALFLASGESGFISGANLPVDGAMTAI